MHLRWLRAIALLPACAPAAPAPASPAAAPTETATSASTASSTPAPTSSAPTGCFCLRHKSEGPEVGGRPLCAVGEVDFKGQVCTAGNPAEGPLPPPDLAAAPPTGEISRA